MLDARCSVAMGVLVFCACTPADDEPGGKAMSESGGEGGSAGFTPAGSPGIDESEGAASGVGGAATTAPEAGGTSEGGSDGGIVGASTAVRAIAAGDNHTCVLLVTGTVRCWGDNLYGQLGNATKVDVHDARLTFDLLTGVEGIAAGDVHNCALLDSGAVRCWGSPFGSIAPLDATALSTDLLTEAQAVTAGGAHTCALMDTGSVRCWGQNFVDQLGTGTRLNKLDAGLSTPILSDVQAVSAGYFHSCALLGIDAPNDSTSVRCWGDNRAGQLGNGTAALGTNASLSAASLSTDILVGVKAISAGYLHSCALMSTGAVRCWGENAEGQLGDGTTTRILDPNLSAEVLTGAQAISAGRLHTCALMETGAVRCWGSNHYGQLGDGTTTSILDAGLASDVLTGVRGISAGYFHTCALMDTGAVRCWGSNGSGQLGDGTTTDAWSPPSVDLQIGAP